LISVSDTVKNALNKSVSVSVTNGCHLEYNMNDLILGASVTAPEGVITATLTSKDGTYTYRPFEKLFPITSIIDPRRPKKAGVQYMISGDPSLPSTLSTTGIGSAATYASAKEFSKRLYFSSTKTAYKYWVTPKAAGMLLSNCILSVSYPADKTAATNKIVVKFETSHSKPTSWTVKLVNLAGAESLIYTGTTCPDSGVVNLYYNGTSWSETEPATVSEGINLSGLKLQINSIDTSGGYLGIIEISARLVRDVTESLESFNISQNSSDQIDGLVPVGDVTANSLRMNLNSYDRSYAYHDRDIPFNKAKINMYKNVIIRPFTIVESEKINLGVFYMDSYEVDEFGEISINALDGARDLQYIKPPDIVTKDMSSVAIIRRLLDSVGFTNYKFNLATNDNSIVTPFYWYTDPSKTVWQHVQDLCKDTQMIAVFDNNDILQFYPRGYIFDNTKTPVASFRYNNTSDGKLANIASIAIENIPSVKAIKVLYSPQTTSNYDGDGDKVYTSPVVQLGAAALIEDLGPPPTTPGASLGVIKLSPVQITSAAATLYSYTGYLVLGKEIIEYDAIQYTYEPSPPIAGQPTVEKWITSDSDIQSSQALAKPNSFKPTGQYRIKKRNAFDVVKSDDLTSLTHSADIASLQAEWEGRKWDSTVGGAGAYTTDNSVFTLKEVSIKDADGKGVGKNNDLFYSVPRSMMTVFAPVVESKPSALDANLTEYIQNTKYSLVTEKTVSPKYAKTDGSATENFVIGTNMYFPLLKKPSDSRATGEQRTISGLAFSLNANNTSGYFLSIATSQNSNADKSYRDINFYKIVNGKPIKMTDQQKEDDGSIVTNINGGKMYRVDIRANYSTPTVAAGQPTPGKVLTLRVSINNKSFVVVDQDPFTITQKIGLMSLQGVSAFDYVYAAPLTIEEFTADSSFDPYKGFLAGGFPITKTFGDFIFNQKSQQTNTTWLREFGPVARELRRIQSRFTTPGFPLYPSLVNNNDVTVVGASLDLFSMDVYVLNNTGAFTALANDEEKQFVIIGNSIVPSDSFEYMDPTLTDAQKVEIVGFDSTWIQRETEAKDLASWMSKQWSKQQKVVSLETFLNPIVQIGDVVEISYPNNELYSSEDLSIPSGFYASKFIVLSIDSTYDKDSPPTTSLACRSIHT
jgi:hypothetical protein